MVDFAKKTIKDVDLKGKTVLLHAELDVPLSSDGQSVTSSYRLNSALPTIEYLVKQDCKIILVSKLGRPDGKKVPQLSLAAVAKKLSELLDRKVRFVGDCFGDAVKAAVAELKSKDILLLENVRFYPEEEKNDQDFAKKIVEDCSAQVFVQDCFSIVHRKESMTEAVTHFLPSLAGLHLENEVVTINKVIKQPEHPLVVVIGGAKIADKIEMLNKFIKSAEAVAIGGAMANNFLKAEGHAIGKSLYDSHMDMTYDVLRLARAEEAKRAFNLLLPVDAVVSTSLDGRAPTRVVDLAEHSLSDVQAYPRLPKPKSYTVARDEAILDIGPVSAGMFAGAIKSARTVIWNGTMGVTEAKGIAGAHAPFAHGSRVVADAIIGDSNQHANKPTSLVAGGDTAGYVEGEGLSQEFSHVSTGGGASLELMSGHKLPGVEALQNK